MIEFRSLLFYLRGLEAEKSKKRNSDLQSTLRKSKVDSSASLDAVCLRLAHHALLPLKRLLHYRIGVPEMPCRLFPAEAEPAPWLVVNVRSTLLHEPFVCWLAR